MGRIIEQLVRLTPSTEEVLKGSIVQNVRFIGQGTVLIWLLNESKREVIRIEATTKALLIQEGIRC